MKIEKEDSDELLKLYKAAMSTPIGDTATDAWQAVKNKMDALGKKYGFDPKILSIYDFDPKISSIAGLTGVVTTLKKRGGKKG